MKKYNIATVGNDFTIRRVSVIGEVKSMPGLFVVDDGVTIDFVDEAELFNTKIHAKRIAEKLLGDALDYHIKEMFRLSNYSKKIEVKEC